MFLTNLSDIIHPSYLFSDWFLLNFLRHFGTDKSLNRNEYEESNRYGSLINDALNPKSMQNIKVKRCELHPALRSLIRHIFLIDADFGKGPVNQIDNFMPSPDQALFINIFTRFKSKKSGEASFNTSTSCTLIGPQITPVKLLVEESH